MLQLVKQFKTIEQSSSVSTYLSRHPEIIGLE